MSGDGGNAMLGELRVTPVGTGPAPLSHVATVLRIIERSSLAYQVHPMGTTLEGEIDQILDVVRQSHVELRKRVPRVLIELSLDDRQVEEGEMVRGVNRLRELAAPTPLERVVRA
jgi:uncharacterized protein (TIGR00106 family)